MNDEELVRVVRLRAGDLEKLRALEAEIHAAGERKDAERLFNALEDYDAVVYAAAGEVRGEFRADLNAGEIRVYA